MFKRKIFVVAACLAALGGCATKPTPVPAPGPDAAILEKIAEYAQKSSISMQRLAAIQMDRAGNTAVDLKAPPGLEKPISITWTGPIEQLVKKVSEMTGYQYEGALGNKPANVVIVSVSVNNTAAFNVLADAGAQAGVAADIVIRPEQKMMAIKYPPVTPNGGYGQSK
jgi:hypothetical protein